jgi:tripartite-type tricarboxylate transporter receptor subunit TctC
MNDLIGGQVDILFDSVSTAAPQVRAGRVKAIATTNTRRGLQPFPELPTVGETIPGFEITTWNGILMPAGTPRDIVLKMNQEIGAVLAIPEVRQRIVESGLDVLHGTPEEFGAVLQRDYERYGRVIRAANIRAD